MLLHKIKVYFHSEHRLLFLMLVTLITAITLGLDSAISKSLLITHFGLFLLWQPIFKQEDTYTTLNLILLITCMAIFIVWVNLWTTTFWVLLLSSFMNGRIFARGLNRATYGLAVIILFLELTLVITPSLFNLSGIQYNIQTSINVFLLILALPLLIAPSTKAESTQVDFIRGFMIVSLTLFLCMGSIITTLTTTHNYLSSLAATTLIAALFLFSASILWAPRAGFSGIAQLWEKYLLNIGGPFEQWISGLAVLDVNTKIDPDTFLQLSIQNLLNRHWVSGVYSKTEFNEKLDGIKNKNEVSYVDPKLTLILYSNSAIGPALMLHSKLLLTVLTFYYRAKLQERQLINQAHLRAVYETGSKLTHDVKNILQSTQTLTQIALSNTTNNQDSNNLIQKQLPLLTQRLKQTLEKLSAPNHSDTKLISISQWWKEIQHRYNDRSITFTSNIEKNFEASSDVFQSIIENLLENARQKRALESNLLIHVELLSNSDGFILTVCDNGSAISNTTQSKLFKTVIESENGFGIGLYQSGQLAKQAGYKLSLKNNKTGNVCFLLTNQ